jgi:5-methylcytosine-specific restriction protein A
LCVPCKAAGRLVPATVVDHVVPHRGDPALFWDERNWQSLCKPCHDAKTAREGRWGWVRAPGGRSFVYRNGQQVPGAPPPVCAREIP